MVSELQKFGTKVKYVPCGGGGHNALDFHIAYYIGHLSIEYPGVNFHIITKDAGFDPLVNHLKSKHIICTRWPSLSDISAPKSTTPAAPIAAAPKPSAEKVAPGGGLVKKMIENLAKRGHAKPRSIKTLHSTIQTMARAPLSEAAANDVVGELERQKVLTVVDGKVTYSTTA